MSFKRLTTLLFVFSALAFTGCAAEESNVVILSEIETDPFKPLPGHAPEVTATVTGDGAPLLGATVMVEAQMGDAVVEAVTLSEGEEGTYTTSELVLPDEGDWTLVLSVESSDGSDAFEQSVTVTCGAERTVGSECCENANCEAGLWCNANLCSDEPRPVGEACDTIEQCITGLWCQDGACSDQPRPNGTVCDDSAQCLSGYCLETVCQDPPWSILGKGDGTPGSVAWTDVLSFGLDGATDLAFNPDGDNELWITSAGSDSLHVVHNPGEPTQTQTGYFDTSRHFLEEVITISFGPDGTFGTCGDSRNTYDDLYMEQMDFMGPVLWPSIEQDFVTYGHSSAHEVHLDMLHSSPECMGMAAAGGNTFFTFNGYHSVLGWNDFKEPHPDTATGHGGDDHSDGKKWIFEDVPLSRVAGVPGHMVYDFDSGLLYVADTGTGRVLQVDTSTASWSGTQQSWWGDGTLETLSGTTVVELVKPIDGIQKPSGVALHEDVLYVADYGTGWVHAFTLDGVKRNSLDTGFGPQSVGGITVGPDGKLYIVDMANDRVLRVDG
jgi:DNA-binding beta-propeller fold protein YncE